MTQVTPASAVKVREEQGRTPLNREEFARRYRAQIYDPAFNLLANQIDQLPDVAWIGYGTSRKSRRTAAAASEVSDPIYQLPVEWLAARAAVASEQYLNLLAKNRVLLIYAAARNDATCPGEMSKTYRMIQLARSEPESGGGHGTAPN